jgi:uncharacterized protein
MLSPKQYNKSNPFLWQNFRQNKGKKDAMKPTVKEPVGASAPNQNFRSSLVNFIREQALPVDKFGHQPRLYALTQLVGKGIAYDDDIVFAAAWLHDLGVFVGHRPEDPVALAAWDSVRYAMEKAPAVLAACAFPATKVADVVEAIRTHQPHCKPTTIEGVILRDADILEQIGAIGILRAVAKVGRDTRYPSFTEATAVLRKALASLPAALETDSAKKLAEPKLGLLREFLSGMDQEAHGALY